MADDYDVLLKSRRYVLGETEEAYGIWHRAAAGEPLERFPLTAEGFDAAEARLHELSRAGRWGKERQRWVLLGIVAGGAALWVATGILTAVLVGTRLGGPEVTDTILQVAYVVDAAAYRLAIGGVLVLAGLLLVSGEKREAPLPSEDLGLGGRWERVLWWIVFVALAVWILSAIGTRTFEPSRPPGFYGGPQANWPYVIATLLEALAFRTWIAAVTVLVVPRLLKRFLR